jgi:type II restriction enzyme
LVLEQLLFKYPEAANAIPTLLACRDGIIKVLDSFEQEAVYKNFNFFKSKYTADEIRDIAKFTEKTGLLSALVNMESTIDYLLGVEVGLDSNARKNRSGSFLESMVREILRKMVKEHPEIKWVEQKNFSYVESKFGISIPHSLRDRVFDDALIYDGKATTIEMNFYSGTGSKPSEIVSSYTDRNRVLKLADWKFVWLTDGEGWKHMMKPFVNGIENIDYVINANLLRKGFLEKIVMEKKD